MLRTREAPLSLQTGRDGPAIEARGLVMRYGDREVLHGIDLVAASCGSGSASCSRRPATTRT